MADKVASASIAHARMPPWRSWRMWLTYVIPLLILSWARPLGVDEVAVMGTGVIIALTHWFLRPLASCVLLLGIGQTISLANAEKIRDTGEAILWQDLLHAVPNFSGNLGTLWQYAGFPGLVAGTLGTGLFLLVCLIEKRTLMRSLAIGAGFSVVTLLLYLPVTVEYLVTVSADMRQFQRDPQKFAGNLYTRSLARFLHSTTLGAPEFQSGAGNPALFAELSAQLKPAASTAPAGSPPDIFVILNESQFSPSQLAECAPPDACRMALYEDSAYSALRGPLKVHTHGWGTWNAEFTLMTGVPYFWFGETGFYSAYTTAPRVRMALGKHLAALGYRTIGLYPTQKGMLNAAQAYRHYGIQEFHGAEDLDLPFDWCRIPDQLMYDKLLEKYRSARSEDKRPIFVVMLTVFNHGPHGERCMDSQLAKSLGDGVPPRTAKLRDYLHRSQAAAAASARFRNALLTLPRRVLLLFAGDHQPSFEGLASNYPRRMHRPMPAADTLLFTNYQFFANYAVPLPTDAGAQFRELDISFLASTLLELAMLPPGPLFQPNLRLREICHGRLDSCSNAIIDSYKSHLDQVGFYQ